MNTIKAIIVAALLLAFASPEAATAETMMHTLSKGSVYPIPKMFGNKKGFVLFWRLDEYNSEVHYIKEMLNEGNKNRLKEQKTTIPPH